MMPRASVSELCAADPGAGPMVTGWYDWCLGDTLETFTQLTRQGGGRARASRLLITPGAHNVPGYHEGEETHAALRRTYRSADNLELLLHWYGVGARRRASGTCRQSPIISWVPMNGGQAQPGRRPRRGRQRLYLADEGAACHRCARRPQRRPTLIFMTRTIRPRHWAAASCRLSIAPAASMSRRSQARPDVLTYTSEVLTRDLDVVGPLRLVLYASSSAVETDFYGRLSDVFPDGRAIQLQNGVLRTRYRPLDGNDDEMLEARKGLSFRDRHVGDRQPLRGGPSPAARHLLSRLPEVRAQPQSRRQSRPIGQGEADDLS